MEQETIRNKVYVKKIDGDITIELNGYHANDFYATNLNLTGCTNWFGSLNMSNLLGKLSSELFGIEDDLEMDNTAVKEAKNLMHEHAIIHKRIKRLNLLELGSGLGRAGIIAAKMMQIENCLGTCVLTDGEEDIVKQLKQNCIHNHIPLINNTSMINTDFHINTTSTVECHCQQLWWGENEELKLLKSKFPLGFDIIIGCDLIYGPNAEINLKLLMYTINVLLSHRCSSSVPTFYFSFTRRGGISIEDLIQDANIFDLKSMILDDYTFDIFNNNVETDSLMWADTIIAFTRNMKI